MARTPASDKRTPKRTAAKRKTAPKMTSQTTTDTEIISPLIILKVWLDGWKKTFTLHGRSSKFELWILMLCNSALSITLQLKCSYILSSRFLRSANLKGYSLDLIDKYIIWAQFALYLVILIPLFPLGSMLIRRMHDLGHLAWKDRLEQAFMGMVSAWILFLGYDFVTDWSEIYIPIILLMGTCVTTSLYAAGYYCLKFLIPTLFYAGSTAPNAFGENPYNTPQHEEWALKLSCFYILFIITISALYLVMAWL